MKIVVQRSLKSKVEVNDITVGKIDSGLVLLVCLTKNDNEHIVKKAADKILKLRIFSDENDKMNKSVLDVNGSLLVISQFTLSWDGQKGNRPSFDNSLNPDESLKLFNTFCDLLREHIEVQTGEFGENMTVTIENHGPATFYLEF